MLQGAEATWQKILERWHEKVSPAGTMRFHNHRERAECRKAWFPGGSATSSQEPLMQKYCIQMKGKKGDPWVSHTLLAPSLESAKRRAMADAIIMGMRVPKIVSAKEVPDGE